MAIQSITPGLHFHPTDVELLKYYLKGKILGCPYLEAIREVSIYELNPWELPSLSCLNSDDQKWYFFCPRERSYGHGDHAKRSTPGGFWKTTGRDQPVMYNGEPVGMIKTLIFYQGQAPHGNRTDWVMHEYRLEDPDLSARGIPQDAYVVCAIFKKRGIGPNNPAQDGSPFREEDWEDDNINAVLPRNLLFGARGLVQAPLPPQEEQRDQHAGCQEEANNGHESIFVAGLPAPVPATSQTVLLEISVTVFSSPAAVINYDNETRVEGAVDDFNADGIYVDELLGLIETPLANNNNQETQTAAANPDDAAVVGGTAAEGNGIFADLPGLDVEMEGNWGTRDRLAFNHHDYFESEEFVELLDLGWHSADVTTSPRNLQGDEVDMGNVSDQYSDEWRGLD